MGIIKALFYIAAFLEAVMNITLKAVVISILMIPVISIASLIYTALWSL